MGEQVLKKILLTGASGTCGTYLTRALLQSTQSELILWVRQAQKLSSEFRAHPRVEIWTGGLQALPDYLDRLKQVNVLIHPVTSWGGKDCFVVNSKLTQALFQALDRQQCEQIHYFSTASLLDQQHQLRPEVFSRGTEYIRSKAVMHHWLKTTPLQIPVSIYYPTLILGGDTTPAGAPLTPLTHSLAQWPLYLRLLRYLKTQAYLHFIHAEDIAQIICYRILNQAPAQDLVLGNPAQSVTELMQSLLSFWGIPPASAQIRLEALLPVLLPLLSPWMNPWDRYSLTVLNTRYQAHSAADFGLESRFREWQSVCRHLDL